MISSTTTTWVDCEHIEPDTECHVSIEIESDTMNEAVDVEEWLTEQGWLVIGDCVWCPVCRLTLHDGPNAQADRPAKAGERIDS